jgi:Prolyl oligopeptidase family.
MKKFKIISITTIVILLSVLWGGTIFFFNTALKTKVVSTDEEDSYAFLFDKREYLKSWVDSLQHSGALRDTFIQASDGKRLHALFVDAPQESANTALIIHGYTDNSIRMLMIGHLYHQEMGYNIFLPDLRGQGKSENEHVQMGWHDRKDVLEWIDVVKEVYGDTTNMVVHGISMGAATTMMVSGETLPDNIKCFVADCGFTSVWDEYVYKMKDDYGLPAFPLLYTASMYCEWKNGWGFKEASSLEQVKKSNRPMFFIHGDKDTYVPIWMAYELYEAHPGEKDIWIVPGVEHANAYWDCTEDYVKRTAEFVKKHIN